MPKKCIIDNCTFPAFAKGFCRFHQYKRPSKSNQPPKLYKIKPYSQKRERINKTLYNPSAREFLAARPLCEINSPECTHLSECINHKKGKASITMLLNQKFWQASCFRCNSYIEQFHAWAVANGHKLSRFN